MLLLFAGTTAFLDAVELKAVPPYESDMLSDMSANKSHLIKEYADKKAIPNELSDKKKAAITESKKTLVA